MTSDLFTILSTTIVIGPSNVTYYDVKLSKHEDADYESRIRLKLLS